MMTLRGSVCLLLFCVFGVFVKAEPETSDAIVPTVVTLESSVVPEPEVSKLVSPVDVFCAAMASASTLDKVMKFPLTDIVARCKKDHNYTDEDMELLERELRRFLYLCVTSKSSVGMYSKDVDNLWHAFILHTRDYYAFSTLTNGSYIHHDPVREHERPATTEGWVKASGEYAQFIRMYEATFNQIIDPIWLLDGVLQAEGEVV